MRLSDGYCGILVWQSGVTLRNSRPTKRGPTRGEAVKIVAERMARCARCCLSSVATNGMHVSYCKRILWFRVLVWLNCRLDA